MKATSPPVRYCLWCEQFYEIPLPSLQKHPRFNHMNAIVTDFIESGRKKWFPECCLVHVYIFAGSDVCFPAKEGFESFTLQQELVPPGAMGSGLFRGHSVEAERISKENPRSLQTRQPLHGKEERVSSYSPVGFLQ